MLTFYLTFWSPSTPSWSLSPQRRESSLPSPSLELKSPSHLYSACKELLALALAQPKAYSMASGEGHASEETLGRLYHWCPLFQTLVEAYRTQITLPAMGTSVAWQENTKQLCYIVTLPVSSNVHTCFSPTSLPAKVMPYLCPPSLVAIDISFAMWYELQLQGHGWRCG